ncbi:MAG: VanZ family protein [Lachnospiraceae bacterium]|jgi:glycopeptide antibiotics resistance protein|nr:VanZ family protein [Lachnospiraceae bacterium]
MEQLYSYVYSHAVFSVSMMLLIMIGCGVFERFVLCNCNDEKLGQGLIKWSVFLTLFFSTVFFLYAALFSRSEAGEARYELELFYSYRKFAATHSEFWIRQILFNILAFVLFGNGLGYLINGRWKALRVFTLCFLFSFFVEAVQLAFRIGLFELDDIFNNVLGGMLGFALSCCVRAVLKGQKGYYASGGIGHFEQFEKETIYRRMNQ